MAVSGPLSWSNTSVRASVVALALSISMLPIRSAYAAEPAATVAQPASPPAAANPPPANAEKAPAHAGTPATIIDDKQIESLLGKPVLSSTGEDMGRIVDILLEKSGELRAAVIDFGGFFGMGSRKIAVDWHSLHFKSDGKTDVISIDLPRDQLRVAPVYKEGEPVVVLGPATAKAVTGKAGEPAAADAKTGEPKPPETKAVEPKAAEPKTVEPTAAVPKQPDSKAVQPAPGAKPADTKPTEPKTTDVKPDAQSDDTSKQAYPTLTAPKADEAKPAEPKPAEPKPADSKPPESNPAAPATAPTAEPAGK